MSFAENKLHTLPPTLLSIGSFFILFWLTFAGMICLHTLILKNRIKTQRMDTLHTALSHYLSQDALSQGSSFMPLRSPPTGIDFIHLNAGQEQILISGDTSEKLTGLIDLDPSANGAWIDIYHPNQTGEWLLIRQNLHDGTLLQAAKNDHSAGIAIYSEAVKVATFLAFLGALPSLALALLTQFLMGRPLRRLAKNMRLAAEKNSSLPFREKRNQDQELIPIHRILCQILDQNMQLINEMQSSLDNVAHDLRTPMTRLRAVAEYALQSDRDDSVVYRDALSDCLEESERVLSMLKTMMSVAEAEAGTLRLNLQEINVNETLDDIIGLYQYVAEEAQIAIKCNSDATEIQVLADRTRISQVWANLLDNAIKYGHPAGHVDISIETAAQGVLVRFSDDGMGISDTEINRIWERLYRGDRSRSTQGLGLGLNYVKAVVTAHGGEVNAISEINGGASFEVLLPSPSSPSLAGTDG